MPAMIEASPERPGPTPSTSSFGMTVASFHRDGTLPSSFSARAQATPTMIQAVTTIVLAAVVPQLWMHAYRQRLSRSSPVEPLDHARVAPDLPFDLSLSSRHRAEGSGRSPQRMLDRHRSSATASWHYGRKPG